MTEITSLFRFEVELRAGRYAGRAALALLMLVCGSLNQPVLAADAGEQARPRIGLVLGGGGAKGAAHIGVLGVLDELRIPVDCVAGTSMGALVGGTFASGMPAAEIERVTTGIDWSKTVGKSGLRDRTPIERKLDGTSYTNSLELGLQDGKVAMPGGLLKTQDIEDMIRDLIDDARFQRDFDKLPIPFRAVATDMVSGEMVVLGSGDLSVAMRASMAVPGAFSPVVAGEQVLSDGGMVRNLPVDIARELCADVVIAVWLASPQPKSEDLKSALSLVSRSMDVMIKSNERAQIETLTANDVGIEVPMGDIGTGDFQRVAEAVALGRAAAEAQKAELSRFSIPESDYLAWRESITAAEAQPIHVAEVRIKGLQQVNPAYVEAHLENLQAGADVDSREIKEDTDRLYALGDFERIEHKLTGPADARVIEISPVEKSWGPDFLRFDLGLSAEGSGEVLAVLRADHMRAWIGERDGQWRNSLQVGRETWLSTAYIQPLDDAHDFFLRTALRYEKSLQGVYAYGDQVAKYFVRDLYGELALGANVGTRAQFTTGLRSGEMQAVRDIGALVLPEQPKETDTRLFFNAVYDTRNDVGLPTRGSFIYLRYEHSDTWLGGEQEFDLAEGVLTKSFPWRGDSLSLILGGGKELAGTLPPARDFRLGGIRSFPGLRFDELRGTTYWFAGTSYLWKLADIQPLFGQAMYAGLRLQAGRMTGREALLGNEGTLYGIAGSLNGRTPVGPFILSVGYVDNDSWELQFTLGRPIPEGSALDAIH
jgi:NTE family protein